MIINDEITKIKDVLVEALPIERLYLFGSFAYGTPTYESDYDFFALIANDAIKPIDAKLKARRLLASINRSRDADVFADYKDRFEERSKYNTLEKKITQEGVVLYERV